eukprot:g11682.t1
MLRDADHSLDAADASEQLVNGIAETPPHKENESQLNGWDRWAAVGAAVTSRRRSNGCQRSGVEQVEQMLKRCGPVLWQLKKTSKVIMTHKDSSVMVHTPQRNRQLGDLHS